MDVSHEPEQAGETEPLSLPAPGQASIEVGDVFDFLARLPDECVDLIVTDPAYSGMNQHLKLGRGRIVGNYRQRGKGGKWFAEFEDSPENYARFLSECRRVLRNDRHVFIMFDSYSMLSLGALVREYFAVKNIIVWDKVHIGMGHHFRRRSELILFASKGRRALARRNLPDVWAVPRLNNAAFPTQKPVELFEIMIAASKGVDGAEFLVCDPFSGSGSAAVAALRQGGRFIGGDMDPAAVELAKKRLRHFQGTGEDPLQNRFDPAKYPDLKHTAPE